MKKNNITELAFIIDRSGSMSDLTSDTIGGFNSMISKQKKIDGECLVTTILFDHRLQTLHDRVPLLQIKPMNEKDYCPCGCTALIDAIGYGVEHIETIHKYIRPEDVPSNTMFVIITDGMENASHIYTSNEVKTMISRHKEQGWEFLFIGANIDAVETASSYGIDRDRAVNYIPDEQGTSIIYDATCSAVENLRCAMPIDAGWCGEIDNDYKKRKKKIK